MTPEREAELERQAATSFGIAVLVLLLAIATLWIANDIYNRGRAAGVAQAQATCAK